MKPEWPEYVVAISVGIAGSVVRAAVAVLAWEWFVVPTFNAPELSKSLVLGLNVVCQLMFSHTTSHKPEHWDTRHKLWTAVSKPWAESLIGLILALLFKWSGGL